MLDAVPRLDPSRLLWSTTLAGDGDVDAETAARAAEAAAAIQDRGLKGPPLLRPAQALQQLVTAVPAAKRQIAEKTETPNRGRCNG